MIKNNYSLIEEGVWIDLSLTLSMKSVHINDYRTLDSTNVLYIYSQNAYFKSTV